ncbi:MAG: 1-acyl-sn-glycerol-3-phosphate acyltransferase [Deltaproteobacteria bacterium]|nr:1-acyl-sn-glycerol-3-phosphate acyltransferase [Deltaproteobacteria bacterium]
MLRIFRYRLYEVWLLISLSFYSMIRLKFLVRRLLGRKDTSAHDVQALATKWSRAIFRNFRCQVQIEGAEHIPTEGPVVVMANHQSRYDIPLLVGHLGRLLGFVAKRELFRVPGLAYWTRAQGGIPLDRSNARAGIKAFDELGRNLKASSQAFVIFPEGTRTRLPHGEIQVFKQGALRLPESQGLPILPVSLDGTRYLEDARTAVDVPVEKRIIRVRIAPLVQVPRKMSANERRKMMDDLRETIVSNHSDIAVNWLEQT